MAQAKPTFPLLLPPEEVEVEVEVAAEEVLVELAEAGALEEVWATSEVVGAAADVAADVAAAELLKLVVGRGLQRFVELSARLFLLAITSW